MLLYKAQARGGGAGLGVNRAGIMREECVGLLYKAQRAKGGV